MTWAPRLNVIRRFHGVHVTVSENEVIQILVAAGFISGPFFQKLAPRLRLNVVWRKPVQAKLSWKLGFNCTVEVHHIRKISAA